MGVNASLIQQNTIDLEEPSINLAGIYLEASDHTMLECNYINSSTAGATNTANSWDEYNTRAYSIIASEGGRYTCNSSDNTYTGWLFQEPCFTSNNTTWAANHINNHHYGINFGASLTMNKLPHQGNQWTGTYTKAARHQGNLTLGLGTVQGLIGTIAPPTTGTSAFRPVNSSIEVVNGSVANWFYLDNALVETCRSTLQGVCTWQNALTGNGGDASEAEAMLNKIATGDYTTAEYPEEVREQGKLALYRKFKDGELSIVTPAVINLRDSLDATIAEDYYQVYQKTASLDKLSVADAATQTQGRNNLKTLLQQVQHLDSLRSSLSATAYEAQKAQAMTALSATNSQYKSFEESLEQAKMTKIATAKAENTGLPAIELYEQNTKMVTDIYLSTIAKGNSSFSPAQSTALYSIANQCPLTGGPAVHEARAMYVKKSARPFNDKALCAQQNVNYRTGKPEVKQNQTLSFTAYPNPAQTALTIQSSKALDSEMQVEVYDIYGRLITVALARKDESSLRLDLSTWVAGQYTYKIINSTEMVAIGKFMVLK